LRHLTRREFLAIGVGGFALATGGFFLTDPLFAPSGRASSHRLPVRATSPILILAPHPDDEVLGSGGFWHQLLGQGADVHVLVATCGDGFPADADRVFFTADPTPADYLILGRRRMHESRTAVSSLGLADGQIQFLGFPDSGTDHMFLHNWRVPYRSRFTGRAEDPYQGTLHPRIAYTGENEFQAIYEAIRSIRPAILVLPHPNDVHPDHWAMAAFADAAIERLRQEGHAFVSEMARLSYLVHWGDWPLPFGYHPEMPLLPPWEFQGLGTAWYREALTASTVRAKADAIRLYRTQMAVMSDRLYAFARRNELFGLVPAHVVGPLDGPWSRVTPDIEDPQGTLFADLLGARSLVQDVRAATSEGRFLARITLRDLPAANLVLSNFLMAFSPELPQGYIRRRIDIGPGIHPTLRDGDRLMRDPGIRWQITGRIAEFSLPLTAFLGARDLLYGIVLYHGRRRVGKTAFRVLRLA